MPSEGPRVGPRGANLDITHMGPGEDGVAARSTSEHREEEGWRFRHGGTIADPSPVAQAVGSSAAAQDFASELHTQASDADQGLTVVDALRGRSWSTGSGGPLSLAADGSALSE